MNKKDLIWGITLILLGIVLILNLTGIMNIDIFFKGWWTLFIIIPSLISLIKDDDKCSSSIFLIIGILLLLCQRDILSYKLFWKLLLPIILIIVGLSLIFKKNISKTVNKNNDSEHVSVFSGQKIVLDKEEFKGTNLITVFGGIDCDLRNIILKSDVVINCTAVFGGIDVIVPEDVKVVISSASFFGGAENKRKNNNDGKHTIYVNCNCVFGGVEIK